MRPVLNVIRMYIYIYVMYVLLCDVHRFWHLLFPPQELQQIP